MTKQKRETDPKEAAPQSAECAEAKLRPAPSDAPLLSLPEAAAYLRMIPVALRALLEDKTDELSQQLHTWLVSLSERRRYIQREPFLNWLRGKCDTTNKE
jgi:hypothetical protein